MGSINNNSPDYARYTIEELEDVLAHVNQVQFPERYAAAKSMLTQKLTAQASEPDNDSGQTPAAPPIPKWSELHAVTRVVMVALLTLMLFLVPSMFNKFITAKTWSDNTGVWIWTLGSLLAVMWVVCLVKDTKFAQHLTRNWAGKFSAVLMPLLFLMFSFMFIDKSLPLLLHMISTQQTVRYDMDYRKVDGRKHCRQRVEILATKDLESGDLCMSESLRNSLPETGTITVLGTRSQFGMVINSFLPL